MALITDEVAAELRKEFEQLKDPVRLAVFSQALADPGIRAGEAPRRGARGPRAPDHRRVVQLRARHREGRGAEDPAHPRHRHPGRGRRTTASACTACPPATSSARWWTRSSTSRSGDSGLSAPTREALAALERPVHVQVFSTPDLTVLPPGGPPGLPVRDGERPRHRRRHRGHGFPGPRPALPRLLGAEDGGRRERTSSSAPGPRVMLLKHVQDAAAARRRPDSLTSASALTAPAPCPSRAPPAPRTARSTSTPSAASWRW